MQVCVYRANIAGTADSSPGDLRVVGFTGDLRVVGFTGDLRVEAFTGDWSSGGGCLMMHSTGEENSG